MTEPDGTNVLQERWDRERELRPIPSDLTYLAQTVPNKHDDRL